MCFAVPPSPQKACDFSGTPFFIRLRVGEKPFCIQFHRPPPARRGVRAEQGAEQSEYFLGLGSVQRATFAHCFTFLLFKGIRFVLPCPFAVPEKTFGCFAQFLGFFDRGTNYALPASATGGGRARYQFHRPPQIYRRLLSFPIGRDRIT